LTTFAGAVLNSNGTAAAPSISFASDTNTGVYSWGSDSVGIANGGTNTWVFHSSGKLYTAGGQGYLYGTGGAIGLNAEGTNQNITLTPSGSGLVKVAALPTNAGNATAGSFTGVAFAAIINAAYGLVYGSSQSSGDGWIQQQSVVSGAYYNLSLQASGGNVLIGTNVNSGALLQVGTNTTTSAYGMVFGTDVSLYRAAANVLALDSGDALQLGNAYVNTVAVSTGTVTIRDSTGTVYRLLCVV
jgi:hypothetical protein